MISGGKLGDMYGVILVYQTHSGFSVIRPSEKPAPAGHYPLIMTNTAMENPPIFNR